MKRIWLKRKLKKSDVTFIQSYTISSWVCSSKITIDNSDKIATRWHNIDKSNSKWRAYWNESEKNDEITTVVVETNWKCVKRLKSVEITLIHYDKMKELTMTMKRLVEKCVVENECKNKIYKIYSNNQASLKTIRSMKSNNDQTRLRRIQKAYKTIRSRDANLKLRWILKHKEISSNEDANIATKNVYRLSMSFETRRKIVVMTMLIRTRIKKKWESRWSNDTNEKQLRRLTLKITSKHMLLHKDKHKSYNILLT